MDVQKDKWKFSKRKACKVYGKRNQYIELRPKRHQQTIRLVKHFIVIALMFNTETRAEPRGFSFTKKGVFQPTHPFPSSQHFTLKLTYENFLYH